MQYKCQICKSGTLTILSHIIDGIIVIQFTMKFRQILNYL